MCVLLCRIFVTLAAKACSKSSAVQGMSTTFWNVSCGQVRVGPLGLVAGWNSTHLKRELLDSVASGPLDGNVHGLEGCLEK